MIVESKNEKESENVRMVESEIEIWNAVIKIGSIVTKKGSIVTEKGSIVIEKEKALKKDMVIKCPEQTLRDRSLQYW